MVQRFNVRGEPSYLLVVSIVALAAIALLIFGTNINGAYVIQERTVETHQPACINTDPGLDPNFPGMVHYGRIQYFDHCNQNFANEDEVVQYYCATSNTVRMVHGSPCPNGCEAGRCL
ncbi:MAG TPA: hypothetical protein VJI98_05670 [Candidatus Nanoarchaeia archaeon]|nr:hypothetical protein [Candidatus Nanoarchaeia archaeon]